MDQAAFSGLIAKLRDLGVKLVNARFEEKVACESERDATTTFAGGYQ